MHEQTEVDSLVARAVKRDPVAIDELYRLYRARITVFVASLIGGGLNSFAEDIANDVFIELLYGRCLKSYASGRAGGLMPFLYKAAYNEAKSATRKKRIPVVGCSDADSLVSGHEPPVDSQILHLELKELLDRALGALSDTHYPTAILVLCEGLSNTEAANILDVPKGTIDSRVHNIREALKRFRTDGGDELRDYL